MEWVPRQRTDGFIEDVKVRAIGWSHEQNIAATLCLRHAARA